MKRLLSIELQKLWLSRSSRILIIAYFVLICLISLIASVKFEFGQTVFRLADQGIFNFPYIWHFNTYVAAILKIFLAVIIVSMISNEYSYGTLKQNLIDGLTKKEFVASKVTTILFLAFVSTVIVFGLSMILGSIFSSYNEFSIVVTDIDYLLAYFVKLVAFFSFCLFLSMLVKRSAFALGFLVLWTFIEGVSYGILRYVYPKLAESLYRFFPLESMSELILNPVRRLSVVKYAESQAGIANANAYSVDYLQIGIVLVWASLFIYGSYVLLKKRNL